MNNRGSLKQIVIETVSVLVNIAFSKPTSKSDKRAEGMGKKYMYDHARNRINMQIKIWEKTLEPVLLALLQRADIL